MKNKKQMSLYVVASNNYAKVGITSDIQKRLVSLEHANPAKLQVLACLLVGGSDLAEAVEWIIHNHLKSIGLHHRLEWFNQSESVCDVVCQNFARFKKEAEDLVRVRSLLCEVKILLRKNIANNMATRAEFIEMHGREDYQNYLKDRPRNNCMSVNEVDLVSFRAKVLKFIENGVNANG